MKNPHITPSHETRKNDKPSTLKPAEKKKNPMNAKGNVNSQIRTPRNRRCFNTIDKSNLFI
jgi:hypothetical protein